MRQFRLEIACPAGAPLVGGWTDAPAGVDGTYAQDAAGRPVLPASALRGALRQTLERLLRGAGEPACQGGDGVEPGAVAEPRPCALVEGGPCDACRLFGGHHDGAPPPLVLGEAQLAAGLSIRPVFRHGVAVDRGPRSAKENRLFTWSLPAPDPDLRFVAEGSLGADSDDEAERLYRRLGAAVRCTTHLGRGRSRGLGRVDMELVPVETRAPSSVSAWPEGTQAVQVAIELLGPACIAGRSTSPIVRDTRDFIPGSTFRGALGTALAHAGSGNEDPAFRALFHEDGRAVFDPLHPVDDPYGEGLSGRWPRTARRCSFRPDHPVVDTLLDRIAVSAAVQARRRLAADAPLLEVCGVPGCGAPLDHPEGRRRASGDPPARATVRVSIDRRFDGARDKHLFTDVLLEPGTAFSGTVRGIPAEGLELLQRGLALPLTVGRGRARGWGRVKVVRAAPLGPQPTVRERGERFDRALREHLAACGLPSDTVGRLLAVSLLSPLLLASSGGETVEGESLLASALGAGATPVCAARRFAHEAGWDQRPGMRRPIDATPSVEAGGVFVFRLDKPWSDLADRLEALEREGLGARCFQGFGRVLFFDPFITRREFRHG